MLHPEAVHFCKDRWRCTLEEHIMARAIAFKLEDGISWAMGGAGNRNRTESDVTAWKVARGAAGRMAPTGFPQGNEFVPPFSKPDES